ncbi:MAG: FtsQ-type POTRA domain-containing protein [Lachnospiraceae bacterium]|nr:FtsQ-type POTRA domain-containing protein [Lachnospiraceae bacterium]
MFSIKTLDVSNMEKYSKAEILEKAGICEGMNLFQAYLGKSRNSLLSDPYFESVNLKITGVNSLELEIKERKVRGYVPFMGSYLYIDEYGRVLETSSYYTKPLPLVNGLEFAEFRIGELLPVTNTESFDIILKIAQIMTKYEMLDSVVKIDVSNPEKIYAYMNKVEIILGDTESIDEKIRTMAEVIKTIPADDRGTLDISDLSKPIIFKYLT